MSNSHDIVANLFAVNYMESLYPGIFTIMSTIFFLSIQTYGINNCIYKI